MQTSRLGFNTVSPKYRGAYLTKLLLCIAAVVMLSAACQLNSDAGNLKMTPLVANTVPPMPTLDEGEIAAGRQIYIDYCSECHGPDLEGEADWKLQNEDKSFRAPPHDASGHTWHHSDAVLLEAIRLGGTRLTQDVGGTSNMPAYNGILTEAQIWAVLAFIKSTWPEEAQRVQWEQTARSQP